MLRRARRFRSSSRVRRWSLILAGAVVVLAALVFLLVRHPRDPALYPPAPGAEAVDVFVVDNGFHSDLVLPTARLKALGGPSAEALKALPPTPYVTVGWGDAKFFADTSPAQGRLLDGLRALFAPNNLALIRFEPLSRPPEQAYVETVMRLRLSQAGFQRLAARLDHSFTPQVRLAPPLPQGPLDARYFESRERFSLVHLCNHWTGQLISAAGVPTRPLLDTLSGGLDFDLVSGSGARRLR
jgi:Protein of unknown function (DUF2459)